jgi:hypothetical protein
MKLEHTLNDTSRADELELARLEAERTEFAATAAKKRASAKALENTITQKSNDEFTKAQLDNLKALEAAEKKAREDRLKAEKNLQDLRLALMEEGLQKELALIELETERRIEALIGSETQIQEQRLMLEELQAQQIQAVRDKYEAQQAASDEKAKADQLARDAKLAAEQMAIAQEKADYENALNQEQLTMAGQTSDFLTDLTASRIKDEASAKKIRKVGAVAEIGINLQKELSANAAYAATLGPGGLAYLALKNPPAIVRAVIGTARVLAFQKGGYVEGPSHSQGGIPGVVKSTGQPIEFEGGEFFFSRKAVRRIGADKLSRINNYYTNRFEVGGPVRSIKRFADGGTVGNIEANAEDFKSVLNAMMEKMDAQIESNNRRFERIKVINVVTDTEEGIKTVNQIRDDADV